MSRTDRLCFLISLCNNEALNEIDRLNGLNTYEPVLESKFIPRLFNKYAFTQKLFVFFVVVASPLWNLFFLLKALLGRIKNHRICYKGKKLFLLASHALPKVVKNAGIIEDKEDKWLVIPWIEYKQAEGKEIINVFNLLEIRDIWESYWNSVILSFFLLRKKGHKYTLPVLKAFRWFLYNNAIRMVSVDVELVFSNHKNSYATLFDYLPHTKKTLIQHGTEILMENPQNIKFPYYRYNEQFAFWAQNLPFKYKKLTKLFCFSQKEKIALKMSVLNCEPETVIVGYSLKSFNENLEGDVAVLIIGYYSLYYEREQLLLSMLNNSGIKVYLKNHPNFSAGVYSNFLNKYNFTLLDGPRFPKVNVVFSYGSTLALEYEALGTKIILYDKLNREELDIVVKQVVANLKGE